MRWVPNWKRGHFQRRNANSFARGKFGVAAKKGKNSRGPSRYSRIKCCTEPYKGFEGQVNANEQLLATQTAQIKEREVQIQKL